jgi:hypothetical protein
MFKTVSLFALILLTFTATAQELENALLWKVQGDGLETSYIYGTMHVLCDATLSAQVEEALEVTQLVVLELDMDSPTLQTEMMKRVMFPKGESISKNLTVEEYKILDAFLQEHAKMGLKLLDNMSPIMIESLLIPSMMDCLMQSIEGNLLAHAKREQEEVLGLETVDDQFDAFDAIPIKEQAQSLLKKAKDGIEKDKAMFKKMQDAYMKQELNALMRMMISDGGDFMENSEVLLDNRNKKWIPRIMEISKKQSAFYGVGAAHLAGESGVIQLLRKEGYTVTPVLAN